MKHLAKILLVAGFLTGAAVRPSPAQPLANFSAAFSDVGFGARALGMGQAYTALVSGPEALAWNVAGMAGQQGMAATFSYARQFGLIPYGFFGMSVGLGKAFALGMGGIYSGDEYLHESTLLVGTAGQFQLEGRRIRWGLLLSFYSARYGSPDENLPGVSGSAGGFGLSAGVQYFLSSRIILATSLRNPVNSIVWDSSTRGRYRQGLPVEWTIGLGLMDLTGLNFDLDLRKSLYRDVDDQVFFGAELPLPRGLYLRAGSGNSLERWERLFYSVGAGLSQELSRGNVIFSLDGAYIFHPLANMLRLSFSLHFR